MAWIEKIGTLENYDSYLRCHILPHFGTTALGDITALDIRHWTNGSADAGYARVTIQGWVNLLSMILTDAVDQRLIPTNPIQKHRRRGRRSRTITPEKSGPPRAGPAHRRPGRHARRPHRPPADHHRRLDRLPLGRTRQPAPRQPRPQPRTTHHRDLQPRRPRSRSPPPTRPRTPLTHRRPQPPTHNTPPSATTVSMHPPAETDRPNHRRQEGQDHKTPCHTAIPRLRDAYPLGERAPETLQ